MWEKRAALYTDLMEFIIRISDYMLESEKELRERIGELMGGQVLKLRSEELREEGMERSLIKGVEIMVLIKDALRNCPKITFNIACLFLR